MSDLVAFLKARLAEDEAFGDRMAEQYAAMGRLIPAGEVRLHSLTEFTARRLLSEVEAKRRIVAIYENACSDLCPEKMIYALAAVYRDHPDYDPAWA